MIISLKNVAISRQSLIIQLINDKGLKHLVEEIASLSMRSAEQEESYMRYEDRGSPFRGASNILTQAAKTLPQEGLWGNNNGHQRK